MPIQPPSNGQPTDPVGILKGPAVVPQTPHTQDEDDIVAAFTHKRHHSEQLRRTRELEWEYNDNYVKGNQLIVRDRMTGTTLRVVVDDDVKQKYVVNNYCRPIEMAYVGKHTRVIPGFDIIPGGPDQEDIQAAELLEAYLDLVNREEKLDVKYKRAIEYLPSFGNGIFQLSWDFMKGRCLAWCQQCQFVSESFEEGEPCPYCAEQINALQEQQVAIAQMGMQQGLQPPPIQPPPPPPLLVKLYEGAVDVSVPDVRDFYVDPGAVELEKAQWCYTKKTLPVAAIRRRFPEAAAKIQNEPGLFTDKYVRYAGNGVDARIETSRLLDYTLLYEYHEMPSAEFPDGQLIYICCDRVLYQGPNPYVKLLKRLPFFIFRAARNPGEFWGHPWMTDVCPLQRELNKLLTQMRQHRELCLAPQYVKTIGAGFGPDKIDTTPGKIFTINANGSAPRLIERPPLPQYTEVEAARLINAMKEKAGVTDQELGLATNGLSGRSAAIIDAQSNETIAPILLENSTEWLALNEAILTLAQYYESPTKRWQVPGHSRPKSYVWQNINMAWDIKLSEVDVLSKNSALRLQQQMELLQIGAYTNPDTGMPDFKAFAKASGLSLPATLADYKAPEYANAAQLPERIARGEQVLPQPWDDANIRSEVLTTWLRADGQSAAPDLKAAVAQLWLLYAQAMRPTQSAMETLPMRPPMAPPGQQGTPIGPGTPHEGQGPGAQPSGGQPTTEAGSMIQQADQSAEGQARMVQHEH